MRRLTNAQIARALHSTGRTVEEIALTLKDTPTGVREMIGDTSDDDLYTSAVAQNDYARKFRGVLRFKNIHAATESVARIDALWREFVEARDLRGMHQAQLMALIGKNRSEGVGKDTCARLFGEWLQAHLWGPS